MSYSINKETKSPLAQWAVGGASTRGWVLWVTASFDTGSLYRVTAEFLKQPQKLGVDGSLRQTSIHPGEVVIYVVDSFCGISI